MTAACLLAVLPVVLGQHRRGFLGDRPHHRSSFIAPTPRQHAMQAQQLDGPVNLDAAATNAMQTLLFSAGFGMSPPSASPVLETVSLKGLVRSHWSERMVNSNDARQVALAHAERSLASLEPAVPVDSAADDCSRMARENHVVVGSSWGSLALPQKEWWAKMGCDRLMKAEATANECSRVARENGVQRGKSWGSLSEGQKQWWATFDCDRLLVRREASAKAMEARQLQVATTATSECNRMAAANGVVTGKSWGSLNDTQRKWWTKTECDRLIKEASATSECGRLSRENGVEIGKSWGDLKPEQREWWSKMGCDKRLNTAAAASSHTVVLSTTADAPATPQEQPPKTIPAAKPPAPRVRYPRVLPDAQEIQLQLANSQ